MMRKGLRSLKGAVIGIACVVGIHGFGDRLSASAQPSGHGNMPPIAFSARDGLFIITGRDRTRLLATFEADYYGLFERLTWSPDGTQIAFVHDSREVFLQAADGSALNRVFKSDCYRPTNYRLQWTADGKTLLIEETCAAATPDSKGSLDLYRVDATDQTVQRVEGIPTPLASTLFLTPAGDALAFVRDRRIYTVNTDGTELTPLISELGIYTAGGSPLVWSPDGQQLAFFSGEYPYQQLEVINADGSGRRSLTPINNHEIYRYDIAWSPDGQALIYYRGADFPDTPDPEETLEWVDVNTGERYTVAAPDLYDAVSWSPDGTQIAIAVGQVFTSQHIYQLDLATQERTRLTDLPASSVFCTAWSPDSQWVAFTASPDFTQGDTDLYAVRADGTDLMRLNAATSHACEFVWRSRS